MLAELTAACKALDAAVSAVDPSLLSGIDCAEIVELLARSEKRCAGLRVLAAARASQCGAHKSRGFSSATRWLADVSGVTTGEAKVALDIASSLDSCPATREALRAGDLSVAEAAEITRTEASVPGAESELL
jgi:hypothetical protein